MGLFIVVLKVSRTRMRRTAGHCESIIVGRFGNVEVFLECLWLQWPGKVKLSEGCFLDFSLFGLGGGGGVLLVGWDEEAKEVGIVGGDLS